MPITPLRQRNLRYTIAGRGPDLVMLHGLSSDATLWHMCLAPWLRREFRLITCELRGDDATPGNVWRLMDRLHIRRALLAGHESCAGVCIACARGDPGRVAKVIAMDPAPAGLPPEVRDILTPALLTCGRASPWLGCFEYLRASLPHCQAVLLPGGGRFGSLESPDLLSRRILDFLRADAGYPSADLLSPAASNRSRGAGTGVSQSDRAMR